jgi:hypothetical protein
MADTMSPTQEKLIRESTNFQSCVLVMLNGKQRRLGSPQQIASRLSKFCYARVYQFKKPGFTTKDLTAKEIEALF